METEKVNLKKVGYLSLGLGLIAAFLLALKIIFPAPVIEVLPIRSLERPVSFNWDLLRKPLSVQDPSLSVELSVLPQDIYAGEKVSLTAQVEGVSQGPFTFAFDCENDGNFELKTEPTFQKKYEALDLCSFSSEGSYTARVVVEGFFQFFQNEQEIQEKKTSQTDVVLAVKNSNLAPVFSNCDVDSVEGTTQLNFKFNFTALAQDPNGGEVKYEWDFGDGNVMEGQNVEWTYKKAGLYIPRVKAVDSLGGFSYCVVKSLTILSGLSPLEQPQKPLRVGRTNPFVLVSPNEFLLAQSEQATSSQSLAGSGQTPSGQAITTKQ